MQYREGENLNESNETAQSGAQQPTQVLDHVFVVIPMLNEEGSIGLVLKDLPPVNQVIVVDNGSEDRGPEIARQSGADVILEPQRGYGKACLTGIARVHELVAAAGSTAQQHEAIIVFLDADYSDIRMSFLGSFNPFLMGAAILLLAQGRPVLENRVRCRCRRLWEIGWHVLWLNFFGVKSSRILVLSGRFDFNP